MANRHFAALGDVWKHLLLAELLRLDPPRFYWETHAGSATYPLTESDTRRHGALRFLSLAPGDTDLSRCAYLETLRAMPGVYPGSAMLAMRALGPDAEYVLCDVDPESVASLRDAGCPLGAGVIEGDGVSAVLREAQRGAAKPAETLVVVDPFDPHERRSPDSTTPLELASRLARQGYRLFYWYGYEEADQRGWAGRELGRLAPEVPLWCGDCLIPAPFVYPEQHGVWGCGVVLAHASAAAAKACERLGRALERLYVADVAAGNEPSRLAFSIIEGSSQSS